MKKQKLMILGAGKFQVPIIKQAQQMGFETITVSIDGNYPGFSVAHRRYKIDVREKERILEIARREEICGILTDQTDISVPTVAYVAEKMRLPGNSLDCAFRFTNKYQMRQLCKKIGIPTPIYFPASSMVEAQENAQQLGFPLVMKPVDNQGGRGVTRVNHPDELEVKFKDAMGHSTCGLVILEEFLSGREIVVEGFVSDYRYSNLVIGDREYFAIPDTFIPSQTMFPSNLNGHLIRKLLDLDCYLIKSFNPQFGLTHSEYVVDESGENVWLIETAIRGGGVFISSDLVPLSCGVNVNLLLIELASGREQRVALEKNKLWNRAAGYVCFYLPEGVIRRIDGVASVESLPGVHKAYLQDFEVGERIRPITNKTMRLGPILVTGQDRQACQDTVQQVRHTLVVEVETREGIEGIRWC